MRILVVEDHQDVHDNLLEFLTLRGHEVEGALSGLAALNLVATRHFDAIVLDGRLPDIDGNQICRTVRDDCRSNIAIVMLSARDELADRLESFGVGADDYITKPFAMSEVLARLEAVVARRVRKANRVLKVGDLQFDLDTLLVTRAGQRLKFNPAPLKALELLMRKSPGIVLHRELEHAVWGDDRPNNGVLRAIIHLLRKTLDEGFDYPMLHTVRGQGYKLSGL